MLSLRTVELTFFAEAKRREIYSGPLLGRAGRSLAALGMTKVLVLAPVRGARSLREVTERARNRARRSLMHPNGVQITRER